MKIKGRIISDSAFKPSNISKAILAPFIFLFILILHLPWWVLLYML